MKKLLPFLLAFSLVFTLVGCGQSKNTSSTEEEEVTQDDEEEEETVTAKDYTVLIKVEDYGDITVELDGKTAPRTVNNFVKLVNEKFYDGLTFHRIIKGFMIQGGDPNGDGTGGSDENIVGEFEENGYENNISHKRGVISMARSQSYDSASSQFFIMHKTNTSLDGQYAAFGKVTKGMDVVDALAEVPTTDSNGTVKKELQPVIKSIRVIDND